jgi:predicted RND superfamily exporter protein
LTPALIPNPLEADGYRRLLARHPLLIGLLVSGGIAFFAVRAPDVSYDYNLLNLQAEGIDAVEVQRRVFEQSDSSLLFAVSLAESAEEARLLKQKFLALPTVHHVEEIASALPENAGEETRLYVQAIESQLDRLPREAPTRRGVDPDQVGQELEKIETLLEGLPGSLSKSALRELGLFLNRLDRLDDRGQVTLLREYQLRLMSELWQRFRTLATVASPEPVSVADLDPALVRRFVSDRQQWLLQVYPRKQIWDIEPLREFITDVRSVDPEATGTPLQTYEASRAIKSSYEKAGLYALVAALLVLLLDFRSLKLALLAMLPPVVGTALLFGVMGFFHIALNPANMIVLPLIMGIGVDGGVHVVHDALGQRGRYRLGSTTFSAILVNTLTTMVGFGSLMVARHRGLYSLGLVLTLGIGACLLVSLVLLPALLTLLAHGRAEEQAEEQAEGATATSAEADLAVAAVLPLTVAAAPVASPESEPLPVRRAA